MEKAEQLKSVLGERLKEHEVLSQHTSMNVGGVADYYFEAETIEDLVKSVQAAVDDDIPYFVIGGGSNVIVSDVGFPGLVVCNRTSNVAFLQDKSQAIVDSGVFLAHLITKAAALGLGGLEFLVGVPGTVGGAIYNNAACWGSAIGDYVRGVTVLFPGAEPGERCRISNTDTDWMKFEYRTSRLKDSAKREQGRKPVILSVRLQLTQLRREEILRRIQQFQHMRQEKQPTGVHSSGSIFTNPSGSAAGIQPDESGKLSAGYLIDSVGGKKLKVGGASVSKKHANFIVNNGKAKAVEIRALIEKIRDLVREKHGILLQEEVEYLGRWPEEPE